MEDWRPQLKRLVAARGTDLFPLSVFEVAPPSGLPWPASLPCCQGLRDFYALCDGGTLSIQYDWLPVGKIETETVRWCDRLHDYYGDGETVLLSGRHVVLAWDPAGAPVIWDAAEDALASFFWKGGGWEPLGVGFEAFMSSLFFRPAEVAADEMWIEALGQLAEADVP